MIYGIGIDLVNIARMRGAVDRWGERFLRKIYTGNEISYCYERREPYLSLAVRFAAKEALIKAIGSEEFIPLTDIEVVSGREGRPYIAARGRLAEFFTRKEITICHLSLSHERDYGIASVVLES